KVHRVYMALCAYRNHSHTIAAVSAWSFLEQLAPIIAITLIARALHINVSLGDMVILVPIIILVTRLPISFGGLGVQEGLFVALFGLVGVSASEAFLLSAVGRILPILCALPWGIHYIVSTSQQVHPT